MATELSEEETNHLRISCLLLKIAPRAVRVLFDRIFPPSGLQTVLNMEKLSLEKLKKKRIINQAQWNLLYNVSRATPVSAEDFDVTLMVCLLRNISSVNIQDCIPAKTDTNTGADISRIKYYRNQIAHSDDGQISSKEFNEIWDILSEAIVRLGGPAFLQECNDLKVARLDQHDKEILLEIRTHKRELETLSDTVKKLKDPVPENVRAIHKIELEKWTAEDTKYVKTRASKYLTEAIKDTNLITVVGNPGTGKSTLIHHVALHLQSQNYEVLPVHFPLDIVNYINQEKSQVFVIDDVCGKYSVSSQLSESWQILKEDIENILNTFETKVLLSCRTNIFRSPVFQRLKILTSHVCDISSPDLMFSVEEKSDLADVYLSSTEAAIVKELVHSHDYDFFPLLCKIYPENREHKIEDFFTRPVRAIEDNLRNLQAQDDKTAFCSLALLVVYNNNIKEGWFVSLLSDDDKNLLQALFDECEMNGFPSRKMLKRHLDNLLGSYVLKSGHAYKALHDKLFDILALYYGRELFDFVLQYADKSFIAERYQFESIGEHLGECSIPVPVDRELDYFNRIVEDIDKAFDNRQLLNATYRKKFILHCNDRKNFIIPNLRRLDDLDIQTPIIRMVSCGYGDILEMLLNFKVNINVLDNLGRSLVNIATENDYTDILSLLLKFNADPNMADTQGFTPLCVAAGLGKTLSCHMLLTHGADPNKCSFANMFPLYWATLNGYPEIVKLLLEFKANPNLQNSNGWTSLYVACRNGNYSIVCLLVNANADPNILQTNYGVAPLFEAISRGYNDIVKLLLKHNADCKHLVHGRYALNEAVEMGHIEVARTLLEFGCDPNSSDKDDNFPLLLASSTGNYEMANLLLRCKADVNKSSKNLHSPLSVASYFGRSDLVEYLLENNADPKVVNENEETPLHIAVRSKNPKVVELLLNYHSDPNLRNANGNSCLSEAAFYGHEETVKILLQCNADPNCRNKFNETPLLRAARAGHTQVVDTLLRNKADPNTADTEGNTPLSEASFYGHYDCALLLLEYHADSNIANEIGTTALHRAAGSGQIEIVELLLNYNANPYALNDVGLSPKDIASICEYYDVYQTFLYYESMK